MAFPFNRHCDPGLEQGEAIQCVTRSRSGLPRRFAPRNDEPKPVIPDLIRDPEPQSTTFVALDPSLRWDDEKAF